MTYRPPYYWNQADNKFVGLVRLLYQGQEKEFDDTILLIADKGKENSSVKWSSKKQGLRKLVLMPIEEKSQNIVFEVAGIYLPEVDLTKQNKNRKEKDKTDEEAES